MRVVPVYVESGVSMASDDGSAAWVFEPDWWGRCGQGGDEDSALAALREELQAGDPASAQQPQPESIRFEVVERVAGDEQAFARDLIPAGAVERARTQQILTEARRDTSALVASCSQEVLDFDDPRRTLPTFANWRTIRQLTWHIVNTESRYYLPSLGLPAREADPDLATELAASAEHVRQLVETMPADLVRKADGEIWTTTKVLRRLAWHERSELRTLHRLARIAGRPPLTKPGRPA